MVVRRPIAAGLVVPLVARPRGTAVHRAGCYAGPDVDFDKLGSARSLARVSGHGTVRYNQRARSLGRSMSISLSTPNRLRDSGSLCAGAFRFCSNLDFRDRGRRQSRVSPAKAFRLGARHRAGTPNYATSLLGTPYPRSVVTRRARLHRAGLRERAHASRRAQQCERYTAGAAARSLRLLGLRPVDSLRRLWRAALELFFAVSTRLGAMTRLKHLERRRNIQLMRATPFDVPPALAGGASSATGHVVIDVSG